MNTPGILYKGLILATVLILSTFFVNAQQLLDDFNRTSSATVGGTTLGAPAWSEVETGSTTTTGCNINSNYLRLSSSSSAGREYVFRNCSPDYNTVLSSNTVQLIWQFKMRQTATATSPPNDLSGFSSGYGMAVILGATTSNFLTANGYAITLGTPGTSTDPLRLVRFTGGLSSDANLTDILTTLYMTPNRRDFDDEYIAVKVIYTPSTNFWQVYVDEDNNEFNDVSYANANLYGTGTDAVYTGSNLGFVGALYNHSTSTSLFGSLDEIYIPITPGPPVTYYSKSTGDLNFTTTWGINLDGSGTNPPNFTTSNQTFNIRNNFSPTISANWTVSGLLAKVILGDTISNIEFTVPANFAFTGPIDISSYSKLNLGNVTVPTIGAIAIPSIVEYSSTLTQTISANVYWDLICSSTGGRTWPSGTVGILDTFVVGLNAFNSSSGTVDFMGTQTQYIPPIRYPNMTNSGGGDRIFAPSGIIVISGTFTPSIGIYTVTGSTINFASSSATSIPVLSVNGGPNYNNLIKSGSGDLEIQGVMLIGGDLTITSGKFLQNTGNTIYTLAIDGDLIISGGDYYFSTGTGANVLTLKGNLTQTSGRTRVSGTVLGRITFAGSSLQVISASDSTRFESCIFTVSNGAYVRLAQNLTLQRSASIPLSLKGTMNVNSGGTLDCSTFRISSGIGASGNVVINLNSGATLVTSNPNGVYGTGGSISSINTVTTFNSLANYKFNSGSPQFPGLSNTTMNNLTIDNTANVTLTANILVNGVITFINGKFNTTSAFKITSGLFGSVTGAGAGKYVNGTFEKLIASGTTDKTFEIGETTSYDPVDLVFPAASNSDGSIIAKVSTGDHPSMPGSGINPAFSVNRNWTITNNGVTGILPYQAEFTFVNPTDVDPGSDPSTFVVRNYTGSNWYATTQGIQSSTTTGALALSDFGDFQIGNRFPPATIVCPVVLPVNAVSGCSAQVSFIATATGNPAPSVTYSQNPNTFFNVGTTPVTVTVSNINGTANCTFDVVVLDVTPPIINNCPANIIASADFSSCQTNIFWSEPTAGDNCSYILTGDHAPGDAFIVGTTLVTYTAVDPSGNSATCSFNVVVTDDELPVINNCPIDINVNTEGACGLIVSWTEPTATDNCLFKFTSNHSPGEFFPVGVTPVIYTASDSSHNEVQCTFNVTVADLEFPVITCPADIAVNTDLGICGATVNFTVGATDNCLVNVVSTPPSGSLFPVGTTQVSSIATDASGNAVNCSFNVTVTDNEAPHIACPADTTVNTDPGVYGKVVSFTVGVTESCLVNVVTTPPSGSFFAFGSTTVNTVATDSTGNVSNCSFNIIVVNTLSLDTTACDFFELPWGVTTTVSGPFSHTYVGGNGLDSVVTINVTINYIDDNNVCTTDACNTFAGTVSHTPVNIDDNNVCTADDCDPITGPFHIAYPIISDNNLCTTDGCNSLTGEIHDPVNYDDNNVCTIDACDPILGQSHTYFDINDGDSCTVDVCHPITGVSHDPINRDDGDLCTIDGCDPEYGVFHVPIIQEDGDACTADVCDPATGIYTYVAINPDDNNVCTIDGCNTLAGEFHDPVNTDDANGCTIDICDVFFGVFHIPVIIDDSDFCTIDACDPLTGIISNTPVNIDDNNACTSDACEPSTGNITHSAINPDDNNVCTVDGCDIVTGIYNNPINIDDNNVCTLDDCDSVTGTFHTAISVDDNNVCTTDACDSVTGPSHTNINIDDNNLCTTDACDSVTGPFYIAVNFDDNDVCTTDACDPLTGISHTPVSIEDNNVCTIDACDSVTGISHTNDNIDDNDVCTTDACDSVTGVSHTTVTVDDNDVCTIDACDSVIGISHTAVIVDDSNACTTDACNSITGISHTALSITDNDACTDDACDSSTGIISHTPVNTDDNNVCTEDICESSTGISHKPVAVDDNDACTTDACDSITGISHTPVNTDDNNACTTDACNSITGISHTFVVIDDSDACTTDACDSTTGIISHDPVNNSDNNLCTLDGCDTDFGVFHIPVNTDDGDVCTDDVCDPLTGTISHNPVNFDDNNVCTIDACNSITGVSHTLITIDDNNICTSDACDSVTGVSHTPVNTDDGDACTTDACDSVTGVSHTLVNTDDGDVCTTDACDSVTGVSHTPVNTDDGDACTTDACDSVTGISHTPVNTDDNNLCTTDACNSLTGITHILVNSDDGNACTLDGCDPDFGVFHVPSVTEDNNACTEDACNTSTGIVTHNPVNTDDGNACTTDACDPLTGISHTPVNVDDSDPCTTDGCNSITGIFHTPTCTVTLNSKIFIQGFYSGGGFMQNGGTGCLNVTGISADPLDVDTIFLSAMDATTHLEIDRQFGILKTNGDVTVTFGPAVLAGTSYFIKINHRNSLETWSKLPVPFSTTTSYLFTTSASMAFGDNMIETPDNLGWAIYNGDLTQDGAIDGLDFLDLDTSIQNGDGGYAVGDLLGDGSVDGLDFLVLDQNTQNGVGVAIP